MFSAFMSQKAKKFFFFLWNWSFILIKHDTDYYLKINLTKKLKYKVESNIFQ